MYAEQASAISRCKTFISSKDNSCRSRAEGAPRGRQTIGDAPCACEASFVTVSFNTNRFGGAERDRTADPLLAKQVLSQLSYSPSSSITPRTSPKVRQQSASSNIPSSLTLIRYSKFHLLVQMVGPGRLELPTPRYRRDRSHRGVLRFDGHLTGAIYVLKSTGRFISGHVRGHVPIVLPVPQLP
jgi:hypothetical protein